MQISNLPDLGLSSAKRYFQTFVAGFLSFVSTVLVWRGVWTSMDATGLPWTFFLSLGSIAYAGLSLLQRRITKVAVALALGRFRTSTRHLRCLYVSPLCQPDACMPERSWGCKFRAQYMWFLIFIGASQDKIKERGGDEAEPVGHPFIANDDFYRRGVSTDIHFFYHHPLSSLVLSSLSCCRAM